MIHLYYGYGKGKTTSAIGAGIRAYGADMSVALIQFLKDNKSSELKPLPFDIYKAPDSLPFNPDKDYQKWVDSAISYIKNAKNDLIILDEFGDIIGKFITEEDAISLINSLKDKEVIITCHNECEALINLADYATSFNLIKHPYTNGVPARRGIEY